MNPKNKPHKVRLGVNVDHVATLRQARGTRYPDPVFAAQLAQQAGADGITVHAREDRRHIQPDDVRRLKAILDVPLNLEMAATETMLALALEVQPAYVCLVPERREELTTEGGLDVVTHLSHLTQLCQSLRSAGIQVSLFIDPDPLHIDAARQVGAPIIELHTGAYANAEDAASRAACLDVLSQQAAYAQHLGLLVNAGHGLHYHNVQAIAQIPNLYELNIGHSIMAQAIFLGLPEAVRQMKALL